MEGTQTLKHNMSMQKSNNGKYTAVKIVDWSQETVLEVAGRWSEAKHKPETSNDNGGHSGCSQKLLQSQKQSHNANNDDAMQIVKNGAFLAQRKCVEIQSGPRENLG